MRIACATASHISLAICRTHYVQSNADIAREEQSNPVKLKFFRVTTEANVVADATTLRPWS